MADVLWLWTSWKVTNDTLKALAAAIRTNVRTGSSCWLATTGQVSLWRRHGDGDNGAVIIACSRAVAGEMNDTRSFCTVRGLRRFTALTWRAAAWLGHGAA
jgi:hypothetical protein